MTAGAAVHDLLDRARRAGRLPGAVAAWRVGEGSCEVTAAGLRCQRPPAPATADTWYDLASLTKPLATLTLVLLARRAGLLALDQPLREVLPAADATDWSHITPAQLLAHTSGLPAWIPLYLEPRRPPLEQLLALARENPPGRRAVYSDLGFVLLGLLLEHLWGAPLGRLFRERVAAPMGLESTLAYAPAPSGVALAGAADQPRAEIEMVRRRGAVDAHLTAAAAGEPDDGNARHLGGAAGHAGLFGTAEAVLRLASEYLPGGGRLLSAAEAAVARSRQPGGGDQVRALGWQLAATPACSAGTVLPPDAFGHVGFTGTSAWLDPHRRAVLVLLGNRHHPAHRGVDLHPLRRTFHRVVLRGA